MNDCGVIDFAACMIDLLKAVASIGIHLAVGRDDGDRLIAKFSSQSNGEESDNDKLCVNKQNYESKIYINFTSDEILVYLQISFLALTKFSTLLKRGVKSVVNMLSFVSSYIAGICVLSRKLKVTITVLTFHKKAFSFFT